MAANGLSIGFVEKIKWPRKLTILGLTLIFLLSTIAGTTLALKGPDWTSLWRSLLFGLFIGWTLALLRQSAIKTALIVLAFGLFYILLFPGGLVEKVTAIVAESIHLLFDVLSLRKLEVIDLSPIIRLTGDFFTSAGIILNRVQAWATALAAGQPAFDPVPVNLLWNTFAWIVSAWTGWVIEARKNTLLAILPALIVCLATLAYGQHMSAVLYIMLGTMLVLLATTQHEQRQQIWDETSAAYPAEKGRQILNAALLVTAVIVVFSYLLPSLSIQRIRDWISERERPPQSQTSNLAESLGVLPAGTPAVDIFQAVRNPGLPRDHLIESGPELSSRVVMTVGVANLSSIVQGGQPLPLYWRGFTYDIYTGRGWSSSSTVQDTYQANAALQVASAAGHILIQQDVRPVEDLGGTIYYAGEPAAINIQAEAAWRSAGDLFGIQTEKSIPYDVFSLAPVADEQILRAAGQVYPEWVRERFLSTPSEVPERVKALAIELTASESTPYDRALAIENYLRTFPYTLDVPRPPSNRDVVDYFLFDLRKGYCDYYASSMVVLARAAGIPARLVIGYATGTYNINSKRFIITEADAHSWVEIYFPNIGWIPFEPTASRPSLERSEPIVIPENAQEGPGLTNGASPRFISMTRLWLLLPVGLALAGILGCLMIAIDDFRLQRFSAQKASIVVYHRIRRYGKFISVPLAPSDTPYEFSFLFGKALNRLTAEEVGLSFRQHIIDDVRSIIDEIVCINYRLPSPKKEMQILRQWRKLRWLLFLLWFVKNRNSVIARFRTGVLDRS